MTFTGKRGNVWWPLFMVVGRILLVAATADYVESPYFVHQPNENSGKVNTIFFPAALCLIRSGEFPPTEK